MKIAFLFLGILFLCKYLDGVPIQKIDDTPVAKYPEPLQYELKLSKIDLTGGTFDGELKLTFLINDPEETTFKLDGQDMTIDDDNLKDIPLTEYDCSSDEDKTACSGYCTDFENKDFCKNIICKANIQDPLCNVEEFCNGASKNADVCKGVCDSNSPTLGNLCDQCKTSPADNICGDTYCTNDNNKDLEECQNKLCKANIQNPLCKVTEFCKDESTPTECQNVCNIITEIKKDPICKCSEDTDIRCKEAVPPSPQSNNIKLQGNKEDKNIFFTKEETFDPTKLYQITIKYKGVLQTSGMKGFYISNEIDGTPLACTQFEPLDASYAFPCADQPKYKAKFQLTVDLDDTDLTTKLTDYSVISNMNIDTVEENTRTFIFRTTPPISSYLTAWVVSKFGAHTDEKINNYAVYASKNQTAKGAQALEFASYAITEMHTITNVDYFTDMKMDKLDQVALPDFSAGAMENWGLVTYRERMLLWDEEMLTSSALQGIYTTISHELAHQWFGDYVSPIEWTQLWLNEGFATYFEYFLTDKIVNTDKYMKKVDLKLEQQFVADSVRSAFEIDAEKTARSMTIPNLPKNPSDIFDSVSYDKAGSVLYMIRNILTETKFNTALENYLKKNAKGTGSEDSLFEYFTNENPEVTKEFLQKWTSQAGYPLVTSTRKEKTLTIKQERFVNVKEERTEAWYIPYSLKTQSSESNQKGILTNTKNEQQVEVTVTFEDSDWYLLNDNQYGYYRVNYDLENWQRLSKQLLEDHTKIDVLSRIQLVDDALKLAIRGDLEFDTALKLIDYLKKEDEFGPWIVAINQLDSLYKKLEGASKKKTLFGTHLLSLVKSQYKEKTFNNKADDNLFNKIFRTKIINWACSLEYSDCEKSAKELFDKYIAAEETILDGDHRYVVLCTGIRKGSSDDWENVWKLKKNAESSAESTSLYQPLGCSNNATVLEEYLSYTLNPETKAEGDRIRDQDLASVYSAVYNNPEGLIPSIKFITKNWEEFSERTNGMSIKRNILSGIASQIKTTEENAEFLKLSAKIILENPEWVTRFNDIISNNIQWTEELLPKLDNWIDNNLNGAHAVVGLPLLLLLFIASINYFLNN